MSAPIQHLPSPLRQRLLTLFVGRMVPYVSTTGAKIEELTEERVVVVVPNGRKARNHIGTLHAAAVLLAAETATGFALAVNLPDDKLPLVKTMHMEFRKRIKPGAVRAVAALTEEQRQMVRSQDRGSFAVGVQITDESGQEPVNGEMVWAWVPKKRE